MYGRNIQLWQISACLNQWIDESFLVGSSLRMNVMSLTIQKKGEKYAWVNKKGLLPESCMTLYIYVKKLYNFACITLYICVQHMYNLLLPHMRYLQVANSTYAESWRKKSIHASILLAVCQLSLGYLIHEADFRDKLPRPRSGSYFQVFVDNITNIKWI